MPHLEQQRVLARASRPCSDGGAMSHNLDRGWEQLDKNDLEEDEEAKALLADVSKRLEDPALPAPESPEEKLDRSRTHQRVGESLLDVEQVAAAEAQYRRALAADENNAEAHHGLGVARELAG